MTKVVQVVINGKIRAIPETALEMAQQYFGAAPVGAARKLPIELTPLMKPKLGKPIELKKPEIKVPEPVLPAAEVAPDPIKNAEAKITDPNVAPVVKAERKKPVRNKKK